MAALWRRAPDAGEIFEAAMSSGAKTLLPSWMCAQQAACPGAVEVHKAWARELEGLEASPALALEDGAGGTALHALALAQERPGAQAFAKRILGVGDEDLARLGAMVDAQGYTAAGRCFDACGRDPRQGGACWPTLDALGFRLGQRVLALAPGGAGEGLLKKISGLKGAQALLGAQALWDICERFAIAPQPGPAGPGELARGLREVGLGKAAAWVERSALSDCSIESAKRARARL